MLEKTNEIRLSSSSMARAFFKAGVRKIVRKYGGTVEFNDNEMWFNVEGVKKSDELAITEEIFEQYGDFIL